MIFFNLHTHLSKQQPTAVALFNQYPHNFVANKSVFSVGIHPLFIDEKRLQEDFNHLQQQAMQANCLAIGECGLDKRSKTPLPKQLEIFEKQLQIAHSIQKPVVIHCVQAHNLLLQVVSQSKIRVPLLYHGFCKNENSANQLLNKKMYLSFGASLFTNPTNIAVFKKVPLNSIFLETDASNHTLEAIYEQAAKIKQITCSELVIQIAANFETVFRKKITDLQ